MFLPHSYAALPALFEHALAPLRAAHPELTAPVVFERPKDPAHGDYATTVALQWAKLLQRNPRELAQALIDAVQATHGADRVIDGLELAGPGFINIRLRPALKQQVVARILQRDQSYGERADTTAPAPAPDAATVMVEFVSANPTGPLHVGHARQAALGDVLCNVLATQGLRVHREFYYNDAGNQIHTLMLSVQARGRGLTPEDADFPAEGYRGDYVADIATAFLAGESVRYADGEPVQASGDLNADDDVRRFAVAYLRREQDLDLQAFGLRFDRYFLESSLYADGAVARTVAALVQNGHTYEHEGALWLRTTALPGGDDKDRVMRKSDGSYTYFVPDVAYHRSKWERGFRQAINLQGSDHHGTVARVRAGLQGLALGIPADYPSYVLHKMVKVMRDGREVKLSKRAGSYVTLRDLIDWAGLDAVRFFLASRKPDTEFVFDVDLARKQSDDNPVYYVQYAHARICSVLSQWGGDTATLRDAALDALDTDKALRLIAVLAAYPLRLAAAADELAPHHLAFYLQECAAAFHSYYNTERILVDDPATRLARLALLLATRQVLANGLRLLGVSAPERM